MKLACALPVSAARSSTIRAAPIFPWPSQRAGARQQPGRFRIALRLSGRWLLCRSRLRGLCRLGDLAVRRRFDLNSRPDRGLRGFTTRCQRLGPVALLLQRLSQLRRRALGGFLELLELRRLVTRLARQRHLRFDVPLRPRKLARQCLGPVRAPVCRDCRSSAVALSAACFTCAASSPALLASATCVSMSRRAIAKLARQCLGPVVLLFKDCRSSAVALSASA